MPLDLDKFLVYHAKAANSLHDKSLKYNEEELMELCEMTSKILETESTLATMTPPCTIVGDIHGQYNDLLRMFSTSATKKGVCGAFSDNYVFLGDYVDRGRHSLECVCFVFALKCRYPRRYVLLRGNHEVRSTNRDYGFWDELYDRFKNRGEQLWEEFNKVFALLPLACLVGKKILCMHGGLSPNLTSLKDIENIKRPLDDINTHPLALDLLWSDPNVGGSGFKPNAVRGISVFFGEDVVDATCKRLNIQLIVRAHQMMLSGFGFFANRKLVTIFTAPRYQADLPNAGAILKVASNGHMGFHTLIPATGPDEPVSPAPEESVTQPADDVVSSSCFAGKEEEGAKKMAEERKKQAEGKRRNRAKKRSERKKAVAEKVRTGGSGPEAGKSSSLSSASQNN